MKILSRAPTAVVIICALGLFALSQWTLYHAINDFMAGQKFAGIKHGGVSLMFLGGCLDPVNFAWLVTPCGWKYIVVPSPYSRFVWPIYGAGFCLTIIGWMANHWFHVA